MMKDKKTDFSQLTNKQLKQWVKAYFKKSEAANREFYDEVTDLLLGRGSK